MLLLHCRTCIFTVLCVWYYVVQLSQYDVTIVAVQNMYGRSHSPELRLQNRTMQQGSTRSQSRTPSTPLQRICKTKMGRHAMKAVLVKKMLPVQQVTRKAAKAMMVKKRIVSGLGNPVARRLFLGMARAASWCVWMGRRRFGTKRVWLGATTASTCCPGLVGQILLCNRADTLQIGTCLPVPINEDAYLERHMCK